MNVVSYLRFIFIALIMFGGSDVQAADFNVNDNADVGDVNPGDGLCETAAGNGICTLRAAIHEANALSGSDSVSLPAATYTLTSQLIVTDEVTISGTDKTATIIDANHSDRVLTISGNNKFVLSHVTVTNGAPIGDISYGGCISVYSSEASFDNVVVKNCTAYFGASFYISTGAIKTTIVNSTIENNSGTDGGIYFGNGLLEIVNSTIRQNTANNGGGIYQARGRITISNSTFNDNHAGRGGAIYVDNASANPYQLDILNSTLSGNTADLYGGAIAAGGRAEILSLNSTITNNVADFDDDGAGSGGGVAGGVETRFYIRNTILAGNTSNSGYGPDCNLTNNDFRSYGNNIIGDDTNCTKSPNVLFLVTDTDQIGTGANPIDPMLAELAENGGPTQTHALIAGSPAIDAGDFTSCQSTDQRGVQRSLDGTNDGIANCDIGAFEYQGTIGDPPQFAVFTVNTELDAIDANLGDGVCETETGNGICSLRASIMEANSLPGKETINVPNGTYTLSLTGTDPYMGGTIYINDSVDIVGEDKQHTTIDANELYLPISFQRGAGSVSTISNVSIVNGRGNVCGGLAIYYHTVTLRNTIVANNTANSGAGICNSGNLYLKSVSVLANTSLNGSIGGHSGGIYNLGVLTIENSLIAKNQVFSDTNTGSGGGILNLGQLYITNSTLSGNSVQGNGGAIYIPTGNDVTVYLSNVTITENSATTSGGGIRSFTSAGPLNRYFIANSIIANNTGGNCSATLTSLGYNLEDGNSCLFNNGADTTSVISTNAELEALADNGGATMTHALLSSSPALDAGNPAGCVDHAGKPINQDQRGAGRPAVGPSGIARCDIGAYEENSTTANAGVDQVVALGAKVTLDGSQSYSPNGITTYAWSQIPSPTVTLSSSSAVSPEFYAPESSSILTFELTVTDSVGNSSTDTVVVAVNAAPIAVAGNNQIVNATDVVSLDGSGSSDSDGGIASYSWSQTEGTTVSLTAADTAAPSFTAPASSGSLSFELTVTDNHGFTDTDIVTVIVNTPPTVDAGADQIVNFAETVNLDGSGSMDADGTISSYSWRQISGPTLTITNNDTATPSFTAPSTGGTIVVELTVADDQGGIGTDTVTIKVNTPPTADAGASQFVNIAETVILDGSGSMDTDGSISAYSWKQVFGPTLAITNDDTAAPSFTAPSAGGTIVVELTVTDNNGGIGVDTVTIIVNTPPTAKAGVDQTVNFAETVNLDSSGSMDPDGMISAYSWKQVSGPSITITNSDTAAPSFTAPSTGGAIVVELAVSDDQGVIGTDTVTINVNTPPTADAGPDQTAQAGTTVYLSAVASSDIDGNIVSYAWTQTNGSVVTLNGSNTTAPSFTAPSSTDALVFLLTVVDDRGATDTATVTINIAADSESSTAADSSGGGSSGAGILLLLATAYLRRRRK